MNPALLRPIVERRPAPREEGPEPAAWEEEHGQLAGDVNADAEDGAGVKGIELHTGDLDYGTEDIAPAVDVGHACGIHITAADDDCGEQGVVEAAQ